MRKYTVGFVLIACFSVLSGNLCHGIESLYGTWEGTWYPEKVIDFDGPLLPPYDPVPVRMTIQPFDEVFNSYGFIAPFGSLYSARLNDSQFLAAYEFEIGSDIRGLASIEAHLIDENSLVDESFDGHGTNTTGPPGYLLMSGGKLTLVRTVPEPHVGPGILIIAFSAVHQRRHRNASGEDVRARGALPSTRSQ